MRKAQFSIIDLFLTIVAVSVSSSFLLLISQDYGGLELRFKNYYDKSLIISLFNHEELGVKVSNYLCTGESSPLDELLMIYEKLNERDENFIMFIENKSWMPRRVSDDLSAGLLFYNNVTSVCLNSINLIKFNYMTNCGEVIINYGSWKRGEEAC